MTTELRASSFVWWAGVAGWIDDMQSPRGGARLNGTVGVREWFLSAAERGNLVTVLDSRHREGVAWSFGNDVQPLVHGDAYFPELVRCVQAMQAGDLLLFTDWRERDKPWEAPCPGPSA